MPPCIAAPKISLPTTIPGITLTPPSLPKLKLDITVCCKILQFTTPTIPVKIPSLVITPTTVAIIVTVLAKVNAFLDKAQIRCPREA